MTQAELDALRVTVIRRRADQRRYRRFLELLVDLLDKPDPGDPRQP